MGGLSTNHKSLSRMTSIRSRFIKFLVISHDPTHPSIHPPIGGGVSTDFKSSNRIAISQLVQELLNFYWLGVVPLGNGGGWMWVWMCGSTPCMHVWGHPDTPTTPSTQPNGGTPEVSKNSINLELIKIIWLCLKIFDLWTLLYLYQLGLVCRWGVSHHKVFFTFWAQKSTCFPFLRQSTKKKFLAVFTLDPHRPWLDWQVILDLLTHLCPFQIWPAMKIQVQNLTKMSIFPWNCISSCISGNWSSQHGESCYCIYHVLCITGCTWTVCYLTGCTWEAKGGGVTCQVWRGRWLKTKRDDSRRKWWTRGIWTTLGWRIDLESRSSFCTE